MGYNRIVFKDADAQKVYDSYIIKVQSAVKQISKEYQEDVLMELNSHIYESMSRRDGSDGELTNILNVIDRLGEPSTVLRPMIAEKKLEQATRSFNPLHIFQALRLNMSYSLVYFLFSIMYLCLFSFLALIVGKMLFPDNVGFYYKQREFFIYGASFSDTTIYNYELLGDWFIPFTILLALISYILITYLLRFRSRLKQQSIDYRLQVS